MVGMMVGTASAGSIRMTECPPDAPEATFRWVNEGEYLYVEGAGSCVTLPDINNAVENPPLTYHTVEGDESDTETG
ncbi:MEP7b [Ectocarpus sp. CCAP 1310/34]|nr:MEP7b [Ectocarpus sp. CCAP 1310/34]